MARPIWLVDLVKKVFPSRLWLSELTKIPGIGHLVDYALFDGDDIVYLPKDSLISINEPIKQQQDSVLPSAVVEYFIEIASYHWIMNFCICRCADDCQNYPHDLGCIFLGEATKKIDPRLGRPVSKAEALEHLSRCREAGLVHMVGRNKLDTIWLGATPGRKLLTICNCCPCCCLWKALPKLDPMISSKVTRLPGVTVKVNGDCRGCKICCRDICFVDAIHMNGETAYIDQTSCRGCGRCVEICPFDAIDLTFSEPGYKQLVIDRISPLVDLS